MKAKTDIRVRLTGQNGNIFAILGRVHLAPVAQWTPRTRGRGDRRRDEQSLL